MITKNGKFAFVSNTGNGTISSYRVNAEDGSLTLLNAIQPAADYRLGHKVLRPSSCSSGRAFQAFQQRSRRLTSIAFEDTLTSRWQNQNAQAN